MLVTRRIANNFKLAKKWWKTSKGRKIILKGLKKILENILSFKCFKFIIDYFQDIDEIMTSPRKLSKKFYLRTPTYKKMLNVLKKHNDRINLLAELNSTTFFV